MALKGVIYERGSRILNMVRYPPLFGTNGHLMPHDFIVSNVDIAATVFELTGVDPPMEYEMDGVSWMTDVENEINNVSNRSQSCCHYRYIDSLNSHSIVSKDYQYIYRADHVVDNANHLASYPYLHDTEQLYDTAVDPAE
eukprot:669253_1